MALTAGRRTLFALLVGAAASGPATAGSERTAGSDPQVIAAAREARQAIAVIDWFYGQYGACPQPSRPAELAALRRELGDGYAVEERGSFVEIRGISMVSGWLYYTSAGHPDRCTLWRKLGWDPALIWRRHRVGASWALDPGDGSAERPLKLAP